MNKYITINIISIVVTCAVLFCWPFSIYQIKSKQVIEVKQWQEVAEDWETVAYSWKQSYFNCKKSIKEE